MRIVLAPDSFKESMTAAEAAAAMALGVHQVYPEAECIEVPMADGGEGTTDALVAALGGSWREVSARDALGRPIKASYGLAADGLAIIEVASVVGLAQLAPGERDIMRASSEGVATLILDALDAGATRLLIGLGGSATNDGGAGLLVGLGAVLLDSHGQPLDPTPQGMQDLSRIDLTGLDPRLAELNIDVACDVTNPLLGPSGASAVFGPQKGASPAQVALLDSTLRRWADAFSSATGTQFRTEPGAGAAGGLGFALLTLGGRTRSGIELVMEAVGLDSHLADADLVLTGEGSLDSQTLSGKTPYGVALAAARHGVPVIAFAGRLGEGAQELVGNGFAAVLSIVQGPCDLATALREGSANLEQSVATALRLLALDVRPEGTDGGGRVATKSPGVHRRR